MPIDQPVVLPILTITAIELFINAPYDVEPTVRRHSEEANSTYVATATNTITAIQDQDSASFYRIDRTTTRADSAAPQTKA